MGRYFISCKKYTANKNSSVRKTKQNRLMLLSNSAIGAIGARENQLLLKIKNFQMISLK